MRPRRRRRRSRRRGDRPRRQVRRRQRGPGHRDRESGAAGRERHPHHAEQHRRGARRYQVGPGSRACRDRARHRNRAGNVVDATFATNNKQAGVLLGQYIKARMGTRHRRSSRWTSTRVPASASPATTGSSKAWDCRLTLPRSSARRSPRATRARRSRRWRTCCSDRQHRSMSSTTSTNPRRGAPTRPLLARPHIEGRWWAPSTAVAQGVADVKAGKFVATVMQFPKKMAEDGVSAVVDARPYRQEAQWIPRHRARR